ncbi:vWA domain-containing protein [Nocardioides ultimimeridianus]
MDLTKLSAAKLWLISPPPVGAEPAQAPRGLAYLSHALYALVPVPSDDVRRMTVDEQWRIYVNPTWLSLASVPDVARELAHVTWHLLAEHADRARSLNVDSRTAEFWKNAGDATVAATLAPDALRSADLPTTEHLRLPAGRSAEEYFAILSKLPPSDGAGTGQLGPQDGCGSGCDGVPRSHELPPDADAGVDVPQAQDIRRRVAIDYTAQHGQRGDRPGEALRWAQRILEPTIAWEPLLAGLVRRAAGWAAGRGDRTYRRPSRRRVEGVVLPGMQRPVPRVAMVIDTSASVDDRLLERALGEVDGALRGLGIAGGDVTVYSCDAAVHVVQSVRRARDATLAGGGGTDMRVGLAAAAAQRPRPDVVVVFTDGETPWPPQPPAGISVIVALLGRRRADLPPTPRWAQRVECLLD